MADIKAPNRALLPAVLTEAEASGKLKHLDVDVRRAIFHPELPQQVDLIVNLAAVHKEPGGHVPYDYFATNLQGAETVTAWAEQVNCARILFTSSIAAYGSEDHSGDEIKTEASLTTPLTPYGISKLVAEKIHIAWQKAGAGRKLLIVRPGVIFGPGENGNITQMIRAVLGHYFFYIGNRDTRKAGGYIKELSQAMAWMLEQQDKTNEPVILFNFTMDPAPTVKDYAEATMKVAGRRRWIPNMPYRLLLLGSYFIHGAFKLIGKNHPINPIRVRKLLKSNYIKAQVLQDSGYQYHFTLEQAMADWKQDLPSDWK